MDLNVVVVVWFGLVYYMYCSLVYTFIVYTLVLCTGRTPDRASSKIGSTYILVII